MARVLRLVPRPAIRKPSMLFSMLLITGKAYMALLTVLLILITGCLFLTIGLYLFAR